MRVGGATASTIVRSATGGWTKVVAFRTQPPARLRLGAVEQTLTAALRSLGGDGAKRASGLPAPTASFSYLRAHWNGGKDEAMTNAMFRDTVLAPRFGLVAGRVNLERIELAPLLANDDHFFFTVLEGRRTKAGLPADPAPPFHLYAANVNQARVGGDPFTRFRARWYR